MERLEILQQIDELWNEYETASSERQKQIDKELLELGNILKQNPRRDKKIQQLLSKGRDMNAKDIKQLTDMGITKKQIVKTMKISNEDFNAYLKNHGLVKERKNVSKAQGDVKEAKRLLSETELSVPQIAEKTGCKEATVYYHSQKIRKKKEEKQVVTPTIRPISSEHMKLKQQYEELEKKYSALEQEFTFEEKQWRKVVTEIHEDYRQQIESLSSELEQAEREAELLKQDADHYAELYEQEKAAHEHLFNYIQILRKRGNE